MAPDAPTRGMSLAGAKKPVRERRDDTADGVEREKSAVAELFFHVVSENPEKQHVAREMHKPAVEVHRGEEADGVLAA